MISGSVRQGSVNSAVINAAASLLPDGFTATVYDRLGSLPHFNPDLDQDPLPPEVVELRWLIDESSALLFSTPEYAGAMPGAFKNLLEWTVGGVETTHKPTGWINPSSMPMRAANTYASLKTVLEYTDATVVDAACIDHPVPRSLIDDNGLINDPDACKAIRRCVVALSIATLE